MPKNGKLASDEIWHKAERGDSSILSDPKVSKIRDRYGWTPLHCLALKGVKEAWFHPDFDKIKDKKGRTPKDIWFQFDYKPVTCMDFINNLDRK